MLAMKTWKNSLNCNGKQDMTKNSRNPKAAHANNGIFTALKCLQHFKPHFIHLLFFQYFADNTEKAQKPPQYQQKQMYRKIFIEILRYKSSLKNSAHLYEISGKN
jgi:hypothetical protein